jgi:N-acetylglucosamine-6-phosphate deacetylase
METIDIHTHGIGGYDTRTITVEHILRIAEIHGSYGVTRILPAIYPASIEEKRANIMTVKRAMDIQNLKSGTKGSKPDSLLPDTGCATFGEGLNEGSKIIGVHLEGPFLNYSRCGALNPLSFLNPSIDSLKRLTEGFEDMIKIITIAPELDGATKLIKEITDMGIIASMGHSDATYEEADAGFHAGAKGITHIFNAMRGFHHREPGIAGFGLINPYVYIEVIADLHHLHPETIRLIFEEKTPEKIIIISDSVKDTMKNGNLEPGTVYHGVMDSCGTLSGGSMTIVESAGRLVDMGYEENIITNCILGNPEMYLNER